MSQTISPLKISVLDDHSMIREVLKVLISREQDFKVDGAYASTRELLDGLRHRTPDVLVLDSRSSGSEISGLPLIRLIRSQHPMIKIVIYSASEAPAIVSSSIRAGASGFVGKSQEMEDLVREIRMVAVEDPTFH
ncbi:response regulator [Pseudomonas reactans]